MTEGMVFSEYILFLAGFFLAGLSLNLTPCVYPMLTVTVSLFGRPQAEEKTPNTFLKAFSYFLGIVVMYSSLGLFAALTGNFFGGILQNKVALFLIGLLIFLLSLSMFGLYDIRVPGRLLEKISGGGQRKVSYLGLFASGLFVGIFAAPCIGPPIIALLTAVAQQRDPVFGFLAFFVFSLGLGLPYLILGSFSGLLKKIPKSGDWMVWVERLFAVILLGLALFYFSLAVDPGLMRWVVPVTLIGGGIYLGFIEKKGLSRRWFIRFKWIFGVVCIIAGLSFFSPAAQKPSLEWDPYEEVKLAQAVQENKPVVIDFYADWCITCHELEQFVLSHPDVIEALSSFARLRVDATNLDDPKIEEVMEKYGVWGLPTIIFIDAKGNIVEDAVVLGYVDTAEFLKAVKLTAKNP